jgi:hypothetical protein
MHTVVGEVNMHTVEECIMQLICILWKNIVNMHTVEEYSQYAYCGRMHNAESICISWENA